MACEDCEERQENTTEVAYYRWDIANVAVIGCDKHLREIFDALNTAQINSRYEQEKAKRRAQR